MKQNSIVSSSIIRKGFSNSCKKMKNKIQNFTKNPFIVINLKLIGHSVELFINFKLYTTLDSPDGGYDNLRVEHIDNDLVNGRIIFLYFLIDILMMIISNFRDAFNYQKTKNHHSSGSANNSINTNSSKIASNNTNSVNSSSVENLRNNYFLDFFGKPQNTSRLTRALLTISYLIDFYLIINVYKLLDSSFLPYSNY